MSYSITIGNSAAWYDGSILEASQLGVTAYNSGSASITNTMTYGGGVCLDPLRSARAQVRSHYLMQPSIFVEGDYVHIRGEFIMPTTGTLVTLSTGGSGGTTLYVSGDAGTTTGAVYFQQARRDTLWARWVNQHEEIVVQREVQAAAQVAQRQRTEAEQRLHAAAQAAERERQARVREEERQAYALRQRQQEELNRKLEEKAAHAEARAKQLLYMFLSNEEVACYEQHGYIDVIAKDGSGKYRVKKGWAGNIERLGENNNPVERLCVHPGGPRIPDSDNVFLQRFLLLNDPAELLAKANRTRLS